MGSRHENTLAPVSDADGICASQSPVGAGNLLINGALASGGTAVLPDAHLPTVTSDADDSGNTFTFLGLDPRGVLISEVVTGPNTTTVQATKYFKTYTQIAISGAAVGNITVGVNGESITPWIAFNHGEIIDVGLDVNLSSGANLTYSVVYTFADIDQNSDISIPITEHAEIRDETANDTGNFAFPAVAYATQVKIFTSGTLTFTSVQAF